MTQDVSGADRCQLRQYAAVAFGRAVGEADRSRMKARFRAPNPQVVYVDGLPPITPLLVAQFEEALDRRSETERKIRAVAVANGRIELELRAPTRVLLTAYRLTRLYRTRTEQLVDERLQSGRLTVVVLQRLVRTRQPFAVARAEAHEVRAIPLTPQSRCAARDFERRSAGGRPQRGRWR